MSGLLRNTLALLGALVSRQRHPSDATLSRRFVVGPFDVGYRILKSDKYLELAEAAQIDFIVRTGLFGRLWRARIHAANAAVMVRFARPVPLLARVRVTTAVLHADARHLYLRHRFLRGETLHAEVLMKMVFRQGRDVVAPSGLVAGRFASEPILVARWNDALGALAER